jgi:hypothetical protein
MNVMLRSRICSRRKCSLLLVHLRERIRQLQVQLRGNRYHLSDDLRLILRIHIIHHLYRYLLLELRLYIIILRLHCLVREIERLKGNYHRFQHFLPYLCMLRLHQLRIMPDHQVQVHHHSIIEHINRKLHLHLHRGAGLHHPIQRVDDRHSPLSLRVRVHRVRRDYLISLVLLLYGLGRWGWDWMIWVMRSIV